MIYTKGPWRISNKGAVVSDYNVVGGVVNDTENIQAYGGHLIGETIAKCNMPIISAAPELFEACERALSEITSITGVICGCNRTPPLCVMCLLESALNKARGS